MQMSRLNLSHHKLDHILITHRGEPREAGTSLAPPVIEFDPDGDYRNVNRMSRVK